VAECIEALTGCQRQLPSVAVTYPFTEGVENDPPSGDNHTTSLREKELPSSEEFFL
jgi:hypothetical protein